MDKTIKFKVINQENPKEEHELMFLTAAIQFYDRENEVWLEMYGKRHHEIIKTIHNQGYEADYKANHKEGFMYILDDNYDVQFMDRETATKIAKDNGFNMIGCVLTSEDLW